MTQSGPCSRPVHGGGGVQAREPSAVWGFEGAFLAERGRGIAAHAIVAQAHANRAMVERTRLCQRLSAPPHAALPATSTRPRLPHNRRALAITKRTFCTTHAAPHA